MIHFTKGDTDQDAFDNLWTIVRERRLLGGRRMIKGERAVVCFTEAPLQSLVAGFVNTTGFGRYSKFGVMFDKAFLFARGGLPVIYQPDAAFEQLHESMQWRHVRFELGASASVDFTWEREWRIPCDELRFSSSEVALVFPNQSWAERFREIHGAVENMRLEAYSALLSSEELELRRSLRCPWRLVPLNS